MRITLGTSSGPLTNGTTLMNTLGTVIRAIDAERRRSPPSARSNRAIIGINTTVLPGRSCQSTSTMPPTSGTKSTRNGTRRRKTSGRQLTIAASTPRAVIGFPSAETAASTSSTGGTTTTGYHASTSLKRVALLGTAPRIISPRLPGSRGLVGERRLPGGACLRRRDPLVQASEESRREPVAPAEQRHQRWHEQRADDEGVDQHPGGRGQSDCWMNEIELVLKAPIATASRIAAAVTTRPVRPSPAATASRFSAPASCASLIRPSKNTP